LVDGTAEWSCLLISTLSIAKGPPLSEEPGTRNPHAARVPARGHDSFADREALVLFAERRRALELFDAVGTLMEVSRALLALGVGKDSRVGRDDDQQAGMDRAVFGWGSQAVLAVLLSSSRHPRSWIPVAGFGCFGPLFERTVLRRTLPRSSGAGTVRFTRLHPVAWRRPDFRSCATLRCRQFAGDRVRSQAGGAIDKLVRVPGRGATTPAALVDATAATVLPANTECCSFPPARPAGQGISLTPQRGHPMLALPRIFALEGDVRCWTANGFFCLATSPWRWVAPSLWAARSCCSPTFVPPRRSS